MAVIAIESEAQFDEILANNTRVFVDFFATWCGPCNMIAPEVHRLATEKPDICFVKVDVDKVGALARRYNISAMPTFLAFKKAQPFGLPIMGANKPAITKIVSELLV